jgi:hypothetical protein
VSVRQRLVANLRIELCTESHSQIAASTRRASRLTTVRGRVSRRTRLRIGDKSPCRAGALPVHVGQRLKSGLIAAALALYREKDRSGRWSRCRGHITRDRSNTVLSILRELICSQFRALAALRAATTFGAWDIFQLPDDEELLGA